MRANSLNQKRRLATVAALALTVAEGCGKKSSNDDAATTATTSTSTAGTTTSSVVNALAAAFPGSLALSIFPEASGTSLALGDAETFDPNKSSVQDKIAEQEKIANGTADSCMPEALAKAFNKDSDETCYEFDQDMIYGTGDSSVASPKWLGTKTGKSASGEACLVSFTRNQVSQVLAIVDQTLGFGMAAICEHKKLNPTVALPAVGGTLDLAPALASLFGDKVTVTSATLERLADASSLPVYRILIKATVGRDAIKRTVGIIHSPKDDTNSEYSGTVYTVMEGVPAGGPTPPAGQAAKYQHMSITYERTVTDGVKKINAQLRSAQVAAALAPNAITADGLLDLNVGTNVATGTLAASGYGNYTGYTEANQAVDGITFVAFSLDPDSNEGTLAYWKNPGGNYYENARGFNISIAKNDTSGVLEGCATTGAASTDFNSGISVRRYLNSRESANSLTLSPKGFWHPFMNSPTASGSDADGTFKTKTQPSNQVTKWYVPALTDTTMAATFITQGNGSLITRQCFAQDATTGKYLIDTAKTTEAAGFEVLDTGNTVNAGKFIALPPPPPPPPPQKAE